MFVSFHLLRVTLYIVGLADGSRAYEYEHGIESN